MDARRATRAVIDPKVRQVGFVTSDTAAMVVPLSPSPPTPDLSPSTNPLSPVMIPPPRHSVLDALSVTPRGSAAVSMPAQVLLSPLRRESTGTLPVGSYNPSERTMSPSSRLNGFNFLEEVPRLGVVEKSNAGRVSSSLPGSSGELMAAKLGGGESPVNRMTSQLSKVSLAHPPAGLPDKELASNKIHGVMQDEKEDTRDSSKLKEKTSKAERRALQEAQRAAKAAAKNDDTEVASDTIKGVLQDGKEDRGQSSKLKEKTSKADRRALQEAQRAAKAAATNAGTTPTSAKQSNKTIKKEASSTAVIEKKDVDRNPEKDKNKNVHHPIMQFDDKNRVEKAKKRAVVNRHEARNRVELFRHLPQYVLGTQVHDLEGKFFNLGALHPSIYKVGLKYLMGDIFGGNARCISMLLAFREVIDDYNAPPEKTLARDLTARISSYVSFLTECRPLSVSMGNAIRFLKNRIAKLPLTISDTEAKSSLRADIDNFINEKIILADKVIVDLAVSKINNGDVLLTHGYSSVIEKILISAYDSGKVFRVVVVDSRPKFEGKLLLRQLVLKGIKCTYTHVNGISYIMHEVNRVFLGAASVLSNGTVYSRVGTACVAMTAHAFRVPVLICCEAYKFHYRVQLDSICINELGDPDVISKVPGREELKYLDDWADNENMQLLNLTYDATPSEYVSAIVTDYGMVPPTSVPVIVREYCKEHLWI